MLVLVSSSLTWKSKSNVVAHSFLKTFQAVYIVVSVLKTNSDKRIHKRVTQIRVRNIIRLSDRLDCLKLVLNFRRPRPSVISGEHQQLCRVYHIVLWETEIALYFIENKMTARKRASQSWGWASRINFTYMFVAKAYN